MLIQHIAESREGGLAGNGGTTVEEVADLQKLYRNSKERFDSDEVFKRKARESVRELQSGNPLYVKVGFFFHFLQSCPGSYSAADAAVHIVICCCQLYTSAVSKLQRE